MQRLLHLAAAPSPAAALGGRQRRRRQRPLPARRVYANEGMSVPSESFGGVSPERKASQPLQTFFTFCAAKIVLDQLRGIGRPDLGAYNASGATTLIKFLEQESMRDSEAWLSKLMEEDELLGVRILEVRAAYAKQDFEWDNLKRVTLESLEETNTRLLRKHASQRFGALMEQAAGSGSSEQQQAGPDS